MQNQVAAVIQDPYEQLKDELRNQDQLFMSSTKPIAIRLFDQSSGRLPFKAIRAVVIVQPANGHLFRLILLLLPPALSERAED